MRKLALGGALLTLTLTLTGCGSGSSGSSSDAKVQGGDAGDARKGMQAEAKKLGVKAQFLGPVPTMRRPRCPSSSRSWPRSPLESRCLRTTRPV